MSTEIKQITPNAPGAEIAFWDEADYRTHKWKVVRGGLFDELLAHSGADSVQKRLACKRRTFLCVQLESIEKRQIEQGKFDSFTVGQYIALVNSMSGLLRLVGLEKRVKTEADEARAKSTYLCRAIINEMLIILMAESGLRASEICKLKLKNLPSYHGKTEIEVECGKGQKSRTAFVSKWFAARLTEYVNRYLGPASPESWLFRSERVGPIKYRSIYAKVKRIGIKSGIWLYRKDGRLTSRFSPHKMRHTFGTGLLNASNNTWLVQIALGHRKAETSQIYARTLSEKIKSDMNNFHNYLWSKCEKQNVNQSLIDTVH